LNRTNSAHSSPINNFEPFQEFEIDIGHHPKGKTKSAQTKPKNHKLSNKKPQGTPNHSRATKGNHNSL